MGCVESLSTKYYVTQSLNQTKAIVQAADEEIAKYNELLSDVEGSILQLRTNVGRRAPTEQENAAMTELVESMIYLRNQLRIEQHKKDTFSKLHQKVPKALKQKTMTTALKVTARAIHRINPKAIMKEQDVAFDQTQHATDELNDLIDAHNDNVDSYRASELQANSVFVTSNDVEIYGWGKQLPNNGGNAFHSSVFLTASDVAAKTNKYIERKKSDGPELQQMPKHTTTTATATATDSNQEEKKTAVSIK